MQSAEIEELLERLVTAPNVAPASTAAVCERSRGDWRILHGSSGRIGRHVPALPDTVFDLASVTKPFIAATLALLAQRGVLPFETELGEVLPALSKTESARATMELLLSHRAGLDAHRTLYRPLLEQRTFSREEALFVAASARRVDCQGPIPGTGFRPVYSDLGYLLLGEAIACAAQAELDEVVRRELVVRHRLAVDSARGYRLRDAAFFTRVAPTETMPLRGGEIRGAVHDENAWAFSGHGLSGQAGLFGTAESVARFGALILDSLEGRETGPLSPETAQRLVASRAPGPGQMPSPGDSLRAGFDGKSGPTSSAGQRASDFSFGHLGFTGTSFWCDPRAEIVTVLLTNRVCPSREHTAIRQARPQVHDALFALGETRAGKAR